MPLQASAQTFTCRAGGSGAGHSDGASVGTLTLSGTSYAFDSVDGAASSGRGSLQAGDDGYAVTDGPLRDVLGIVTLRVSKGSAGTNIGLYTEYSNTHAAAGCL
jgi:hypothetical protein